MVGRASVVAVGVWLAAFAGAAAARPTLRPVAGVSGSYLASDGRYVAAWVSGPPSSAGRSAAIAVLDTARGTRLALPQAPCGVSWGRAQFWTERPPLSDGQMLQGCNLAYPQPKALRLVRLDSGATREFALPPHVDTGLTPVRLGSRWAELAEYGYHASEFDLLNIATGERTPDLAEASGTAYEDLDNLVPLTPLCKPVERPHPPFGEGFGGPLPYGDVLGIERRRVVIAYEQELLAWRCGSARPRILARDAAEETAQLNHGILTWVDRHGTLHAERLRSGHQWRWRSSYGLARAVHTATAVYAVENCGHEGCSNAIVTAGLKAL